MKQKIVVKVHLCCDKSRKKAMVIAASAEGVISVTVQGNEKDEFVVVGIGVDSAGLCTALRKKLGNASLKSVEEVKDPKPAEEKKKEEKPAEKKPEKEEKKSEAKPPAEAAVIYHHYPPPSYPPPYYCYPKPNPPQCYIYEDNPNCTIM